MAWVAEENFNSYGDGDLHGENGGSGWATAWSGSTNFDVQGTTVYEGAKAVENTTNAGVTISRNLSSTVTAGTWYMAVRSGSNDTGFAYWQFKDTTTASIFAIGLDSNGQITYSREGLGRTNIQAYSANQWYVIKLTYSAAGETMDVDIHDGTSWSGDYNLVPYTLGDDHILTAILGHTAQAFNSYHDIITATDPTVVVSAGPRNLNLLGVGK